MLFVDLLPSTTRDVHSISPSSRGYVELSNLVRGQFRAFFL